MAWIFTEPHNVQDAFQPMSDLVSYAAVAGSVGDTHHARIAQIAGFNLCIVLQDHELHREKFSIIFYS